MWKSRYQSVCEANNVVFLGPYRPENPWHPPPSACLKPNLCLVANKIGHMVTVCFPRWDYLRALPKPVRGVNSSASPLVPPCRARPHQGKQAPLPPCPHIFLQLRPEAPDNLMRRRERSPHHHYQMSLALILIALFAPHLRPLWLISTVHPIPHSLLFSLMDMVIS